MSGIVTIAVRTTTSQVVLATPEQVRPAFADAPFKNRGPIEVPGLPWVTITGKPGPRAKPADVTEQTVENGAAAIKVKTRLVVDDDKKLTTSPTSNPNGPIVLATGVEG